MAFDKKESKNTSKESIVKGLKKIRRNEKSCEKLPNKLK